MSKKRFHDEPASVGLTKKSRKETLNVTPKPDRSNLENRKKKVEAEWKKAMIQQFSEKEANYNQEIDQIRNGTHTQVQELMKQLEKEKEKKITLLFKWKDNQIRSIHDSVYAEKNECSHEYEKNIAELKEQFLSVCYREKKKNQDEKIEKEKLMKRTLERDIRMRRIRKMNQELLVDCNYIGDDSLVLEIRSLWKLSSQEINDDITLIKQAIANTSNVV